MPNSNRKRRYSKSDSDSDDYIRWKISKLQKRLSSKRARTRERDGRPAARGPTMSVSSGDSDEDNIPLSILADNDVDTEETVAANVTTGKFSGYYGISFHRKIFYASYKLGIVNLVNYHCIFYTSC